MSLVKELFDSQRGLDHRLRTFAPARDSVQFSAAVLALKKPDTMRLVTALVPRDAFPLACYAHCPQPARETKKKPEGVLPGGERKAEALEEELFTTAGEWHCEVEPPESDSFQISTGGQAPGMRLVPL